VVLNIQVHSAEPMWGGGLLWRDRPWWAKVWGRGRSWAVSVHREVHGHTAHVDAVAHLLEVVRIVALDREAVLPADTGRLGVVPEAAQSSLHGGLAPAVGHNDQGLHVVGFPRVWFGTRKCCGRLYRKRVDLSSITIKKALNG